MVMTRSFSVRRSVVSNFFYPWNSPDQNTGVFPSSGDLSYPGIETGSLVLLQTDYLASHQNKGLCSISFLSQTDLGIQSFIAWWLFFSCLVVTWNNSAHLADRKWNESSLWCGWYCLGFLPSSLFTTSSSRVPVKTGNFHQPVPWHSLSLWACQIPTRPLVHSKVWEMAEAAALTLLFLSFPFLPGIFLSVFLALFCQMLPFSLFCAGAAEGFSLKEPKGSQQGVLYTHCCYQAGWSECCIWVLNECPWLRVLIWQQVDERQHL